MAKRRSPPRSPAPAPPGSEYGENFRTLVRNRRAGFQYEILERFEAGIALTGSEIKSMRAGGASIAEAYVRPRDGELWLVGANVSRYEAAGGRNHEPARDRKLLLHRNQILELTVAAEQRGLTVVPLRLYLTRGIAKLEIGIGRGRRQYEKRQVIAKREADRQMRRALRH